MAEAIKTISVARGYDVTRYALNCFGGAGGQHACDVADALSDFDRAHPSAVVAALGLRHGARRHRGPARARASTSRSTPARSPASASSPTRSPTRRSRRSKARASRGRRSRSIAARNCATPAPTRRSRSRSLRPSPMRRAFERAHKARFGFIDRDEGARRSKSVSAEAVGGAARFAERRAASRSRRARPARRRARRDSSRKGAWRDANVYLRETLPIGAQRRRPRARHRAAPDDRRRAGLARGDHAEEPCRHAPASKRRRSARRSARKPIRSCSRSSTISSCRSPSRWA